MPLEAFQSPLSYPLARLTRETIDDDVLLYTLCALKFRLSCVDLNSSTESSRTRRTTVSRLISSPTLSVSLSHTCREYAQAARLLQVLVALDDVEREWRADREQQLAGGPGTGKAALITVGLRDKDRFYSNVRRSSPRTARNLPCIVFSSATRVLTVVYRASISSWR